MRRWQLVKPVIARRMTCCAFDGMSGFWHIHGGMTSVRFSDSRGLHAVYRILSATYDLYSQYEILHAGRRFMAETISEPLAIGRIEARSRRSS